MFVLHKNFCTRLVDSIFEVVEEVLVVAKYKYFCPFFWKYFDFIIGEMCTCTVGHPCRRKMIRMMRFITVGQFIMLVQCYTKQYNLCECNEGLGYIISKEFSSLVVIVLRVMKEYN